jgi:LemA protein
MNLEAQLREEGYSEEEAREIVRRAAHLQGVKGGRVDQGVLEESAAEVGIGREWLQEATRQLRAERAAASQRRRTLTYVGIGAAVLLAWLLLSSYSALNRAETRVEAARAQLETVLQRRFDLIPNLVKVTREYATHERAVFEALAAARSRFESARTLEEKAAADAELRAALPRLLALVESNPQLRASELYVRLQDELAGTENRIAVERRRYNQAVADYNRLARGFPTVLVRPLLGFDARKPYFQAAPGAEKAPEL